ncbi:MAG TPA: efflux transporter outer membrane subunit, partial [Chitinolyticbacter sp.]|nr:efflux transporter outer membrane subunit [Chitinolyticbacter sp.]
MFRHGPLLVLAGLLAGCTVLGPDFQRPSAGWLDNWRGNLPQVNDETSADSPENTQSQADNALWWQSFNDPVLDALVTEAQQKNPGVRIAGLRILESRAQQGIAGSAMYPQLQQVNGEVLRVGKEQSRGPDSAFTAYGAGFQMAWELDFWGRFRRGIEAADAAYWASIAQYDDVQVLVAAQTASLYATIRSIELRLRIARENAALQQRSLEITERLFKSGNESELDVQQARTLYLSTLATIPDLEGSLRQTQNALAVLLARPPGPLPELAEGREKIPIAELLLIADLPADLLRRRPDVRAAEHLLAAQSAQIGISEAALYPSLTLVGSLGLSTTSLAGASQVLDWAVGPTLAWNVFDWGRLKNQVLVQDARFQQLHEQYLDSLLKAARELDDAALDFAKTRTQVEILDGAVKAARRSLDIATIQYREGLVDFQRVLDSQRTLFSQQERLVAIQSGVAQSVIAVYRALGGGWQPARGRPLLDPQTRQTMSSRVGWGGLLDAPLPAATTPGE